MIRSFFSQLYRGKQATRMISLTLFMAGFLCNFAFAPFFFYPLLFLLMFVPVVCLDTAMNTHNIGMRLRGHPHKKAYLFKRGFWIGWLFGFGFFVGGLYWIGASLFVEPDKFLWVLPLAVTVLPAGLAIFWGVAFGVAALFWHPSPLRVLMLIGLICCTEWLRGHILSGFPWNLFGYAFAGNDALVQAAYPLGIYGLSLLVWSIALLPSATQYKGRFLGCVWPVVLAALLLVGCWVYGAHRLSGHPIGQNYLMNGNVVYHLVQPNVSQKIRVDPSKVKQVLQAHIDLTKTVQIDPQDSKQHLFIWGENAAPFALNLDHDLRAHIMSQLPKKALLLLGGYRVIQKPQQDARRSPIDVYNSLYLLGAGGQILGRYDKRKLVPFGESLPFGDWLYEAGLDIVSSLPGGFSAGTDQGNGTIYTPNGSVIFPLICYEAIFPNLLKFSKKPNLTQNIIVNLTNDGWFGLTSGPYQHFSMVRLRAVETHTPLIRVSNSGISGYVDRFGRILKVLPLQNKGVLSSDKALIPSHNQ